MWYTITNIDQVPSPAILLYPDRIRENIQLMLAIAGSPARLRPHVKTHKLPQIVRMQMEAGIQRFKCATLREAAMLAATGARDILVAYPLQRPALRQLIALMRHYPIPRFSFLIDHPEQMLAAEQIARELDVQLCVFLDLDVGMERTGIKPGAAALDLYRAIHQSDRLQALGLHVYDGHLGISDFAQRQHAVEQGFEPVSDLLRQLESEGVRIGEVVCGGTPTFPVHARHPERSLSPGTVLLWDWGYAGKFPDLAFKHAAVLLTRVVSKPGHNKLCLDLGHKAVASEMPPPRVHLFDLPGEMTGHSEEHMVIAVENTDNWKPGDCVYGIPVHICPTMALHDRVWAVEAGQASEQWTVAARSREMEW